MSRKCAHRWRTLNETNASQGALLGGEAQLKTAISGCLLEPLDKDKQGLGTFVVEHHAHAILGAMRYLGG